MKNYYPDPTTAKALNRKAREEQNIYTILDIIKFEEQIKRIAKINNIEDPYLLMQGVFKIVQEFHMEILNNKSNAEGGK